MIYWGCCRVTGRGSGKYEVAVGGDDSEEDVIGGYFGGAEKVTSATTSARGIDVFGVNATPFGSAKPCQLADEPWVG